MRHRFNKQIKIARLLLLIWGHNLFFPTVTYALTSGPAQPETQAFQQASVSDMVDLQTGDFKYNIPLLDIDGYPINLNYQSGVGIDDEASWVGLGWSLNTGAINRQLRGLPDDMKGDPDNTKGDRVLTENFTKPMVTIGGRSSGKVEVLGNAQGLLKPGVTVTYGVFFNNYTGIGAEVSINPGISLSLGNSTKLNAGLGFGISSNTQSGASFSPYTSLAIYADNAAKAITNAGLSASMGYNSRSGLKSLSLGTSFLGGGYQMNRLGAGVSYNTEPITPRVTTAYNTSSKSYSIDAGGAAFGVFIGGGITGYRTVKNVKSPQSNPAYGFLYSEYGKDNPNAIMDFIREKESLIVPELPNIAVPIQTHDLFSFTNQLGSGQFRLYRGGTGIFFDNFADDTSDDLSLGADYGFGSIGHAGVTFFDQKLHNTTRKWTSENNYLKVGDHQTYSGTSPNERNVFFKLMGEKVVQDDVLAGKLGNTQAVKVDVNADGLANAKFISATSSTNITSPIKNLKPHPAGTAISYLTAQQANNAALDQGINVYDSIDESELNIALSSDPQPNYMLPRVDPAVASGSDLAEMYPAAGTSAYPVRKQHHISEISVTDASGRRMVYGVPVYNVEQSEFSFAIGDTYGLVTQGATENPDNKTNLSNQAIDGFNPGLGKGVDEYYHKEGVPAYATSYLLSGVLSADYLDKTADGITDDDLGTAIKFNYARVKGLYNWRAPFNNAAISKGRLADLKDDKASVVFGKKEIWYISSIESKTKIAYFITKDRQDALGVGNDWNVGGKNSAVKQKCLVQIRLYSKADMTKPIKVVKFNYNYELCPFTPNSDAPNGGKLTLKSVWFEYANTTKGASHPYKFTYNQPETASAGVKGAYGYMLTDRWGVYKSRAENISTDLSNEEFPYADQNKTIVDGNVSLWHLNKIELPTGGTINVTYESDDYAYVQDKKAMCMYQIDGFTVGTASTDDLSAADGIKITLPNIAVLPDAAAINKDWFVKNYLNGSNYLYTKFNVRMKTSGSPDLNADFDFIPCFAEVESVSKQSNYTLIVKLKKVTAGGVTANPIAIAAWQRLKDEYPGFAYPGYDNKANSEGTLFNILTATVNAIGNIKELTQSFYQKASNNANYARQINRNKSFVRLTKNDGNKIGGGARVERVVIEDNWQTLSANTNAGNASYGQKYIYQLENGQSSGVASYEPSIGNDENPFKQPIPYVQKTKGAITNFFQLEEPFGESVFPSPGITYSRVVVKDLIKSGSDMVPDPATRTGYVVNEYYTTKDFPVKVNVLDITTQHKPLKNTFSLVHTVAYDEIFMSQGYSVELNDMNGKLKATRVFKESERSGEKMYSQVSATEYFYNTDKKNGEKLSLNNQVKVIDTDGSVTTKTIGQEIELFTDFREQESRNEGLAVNVGADFQFIGPFPAFLPHFPIKENTDVTLFRSACAFKVIQNYGILESVVKTQDGSSITTQNIAFDGLTGDALVTRTQNEFNKDMFSVNIPAYWIYNGMSGAYKNLGMMISELNTNANDGHITNFSDYITAGDVIEDLTNPGAMYWVVEQLHANGASPYMERFLMDRMGKVKKNYTMEIGKIVQSGRKNMLNENASIFTCLNNPILNGHLQFADDVDLTALKVINASASVFEENWAVEVPNIKIVEPEATANWTYVSNTQPYYMLDSYHPAKLLFNSTTLSGKKTTWEGVAGEEIESTDGFGRFFWKSRATTASIKPQFLNEGDILHCFSKVRIPVSGTYYIGVNSNIQLSLAFDNDASLFNDFAITDGQNCWYIFALPLTAGEHIISMEVRRDTQSNYDNNSAFGIEIYNNTNADIRTANNPDTHINPIWSTADLTGVELHGENGLATTAFVTNFSGQVTKTKYYWTDALNQAYRPVNRDLSPNQQIPDPSVNPYLYGLRGNWRLSQTKTTLKKRTYKSLDDRAVDIKNAGYINGFRSYWYHANTGGVPWLPSSESNNNWTTTNTITQYDKYGQQLENKDALDRYSAAKFGFNGELPSVVASNARQREIFAESFEDASFIPGRPRYIEPEKLPYFTPADFSNLKALVDGTVSHSGNNSVKLSGELLLSTHIFSPRNFYAPFLNWDPTKLQYSKMTQIGKYPNGFEPLADKYLFNVWVKDSDPNNKSFKGIKLYKDATEINLTVKAIVEGWKLMEGSIDLLSYGSAAHYIDNDTGIPISFRIVPNVPNGSNVYIDDIRMHPEKSSMKTYAYDEKTMRLMAELDENCFATFYEYDSQGLLVRVKKETERGIMTLKESRSSYKKGL